MNRLTIGLPVYNAMPFLEESLTSLLCQTDSDFTILAIDDGSTDDSLEYLLSVKDPRLTVVHQANGDLPPLSTGCSAKWRRHGSCVTMPTTSLLQRELP